MSEGGWIVGLLAALVLVILLGGFGIGGGMIGGAWMGFGLIFMILFWAAIILLIIWLYKQIRTPSTGATTESALDILKKRYAKDEITRKEFEEMKKELESE